MRIPVKEIFEKVLVKLRLSPLSLAEKCRVTFGAAVLLVLFIALLLPYIWMNQLTKKTALDAGRAKAEIFQSRHFQADMPGVSQLPCLDEMGKPAEPNQCRMNWIRFDKDKEQKLQALTESQRESIRNMIDEEDMIDEIRFAKIDGQYESRYIRVFKANDNCISCHNPQGTAPPFSRNEAVGAILINAPAKDIRQTIMFNRIWTIVAVLLGGTGAVIAFYLITQRVILRPIRQLRALANNVAEGNLDIRSSIQTRDEYEKLSNAFNHMLDHLQGTQEKLRQANRQLDEKIVQLSERNIELYKANKVKSEFLANMSHEFRTPLNAILGFAEILREKPGLLSKDKSKKYAENIISGGKNLLNMINDLLDLAKTEAGKMRLHVEKVNIQQLCRDVVAAFSSLTRKKKIKVKLNVDPDIPIMTTDGGKIQQILYNFLSNAVKFTPDRGRIEVTASLIDDMMVRIAVTDTGCGISESDQEKIFDKFRQVDGSLTRASAGSGLGLAISKELANLLAGTIDMKSTSDQGSTFWIEIPINLAKENDDTRADPGPPSQ